MTFLIIIIITTLIIIIIIITTILIIVNTTLIIRNKTDKITGKKKSRAFRSITYTADGEFLLAAGDGGVVCLYHVSQEILFRKFQISCNLSLDGTQVCSPIIIIFFFSNYPHVPPFRLGTYPILIIKLLVIFLGCFFVY